MGVNRAKAEGICLKRMKELDSSGKNFEYYSELFKSMSNADFDNFMQKMISGENPLSVIIPNYSDVGITVENNIQMAQKMNYDLYKRIWVKDPLTGVRFLTTLKHLVVEMNVCRQIQSLDHKMAYAEHNRQVDERTGQATGDSRKAGLSGPEMMMLRARSLNNTIVELMKFRGGDNLSMRDIDDQIVKTGQGSMSSVPGAQDRSTKSVQTLSCFLTAMGFENNAAG